MIRNAFVASAEVIAPKFLLLNDFCKTPIESNLLIVAPSMRYAFPRLSVTNFSASVLMVAWGVCATIGSAKANCTIISKLYFNNLNIL